MSEDLFSKLNSSVPRIAHLENNSYIYGCLPDHTTSNSIKEDWQIHSSKILKEQSLNERIFIDRSSSIHMMSVDLDEKVPSEAEDVENFQKEMVEDKFQGLEREENLRYRAESVQKRIDESYQNTLSDKFPEIQELSMKDTSPSKESFRDRTENVSCEQSYVFSEANFQHGNLNNRVPSLHLNYNNYSPSMREDFSPVNDRSQEIKQEIDRQIKMKEKKMPRLKTNWSNLGRSKKQHRKRSFNRNSRKRSTFNKSPYARKIRPAKTQSRKNNTFLHRKSPFQTTKPKDQFVNKLISIIDEHSKHCASMRAQVDLLRSEYASLLF